MFLSFHYVLYVYIVGLSWLTEKAPYGPLNLNWLQISRMAPPANESMNRGVLVNTPPKSPEYVDDENWVNVSDDDYITYDVSPGSIPSNTTELLNDKSLPVLDADDVNAFFKQKDDCPHELQNLIFSEDGKIKCRCYQFFPEFNSVDLNIENGKNPLFFKFISLTDDGLATTTNVVQRRTQGEKITILFVYILIDDIIDHNLDVAVIDAMGSKIIL